MSEAKPLQSCNYPENMYIPAMLKNDLEKNSSSKNKSYNRLKLILSLTESAVNLIALAVFIFSGYAVTMGSILEKINGNDYLNFLIYAVMLGIFAGILQFPLEVIGGYFIERQYGLSTLNFWGWLKEKLKVDAVAFGFLIMVVSVVYLTILNFGNNWWIVTAILFYLFAVLLARLAPVLLFPLFYKFEPIESETLKEKLAKICKQVSLTVEGVYRFDMSKKTRKANAAFAGIGRSKRILLSDTLLNKFTEDEIEIIAAHEAGHYHHRHIPKLLGVSALFVFITLGVTAEIHRWAASEWLQTDLTNPALIPFLALIAGLATAVLTPIQNLISRTFENQADKFALEYSRAPDIYITAMQKLSSTNLADESPHPVVEFLFYSHPSIRRRIRRAEQFSVTVE